MDPLTPVGTVLGALNPFVENLHTTTPGGTRFQMMPPEFEHPNRFGSERFPQSLWEAIDVPLAHPDEPTGGRLRAPRGVVTGLAGLRIPPGAARPQIMVGIDPFSHALSQPQRLVPWGTFDDFLRAGGSLSLGDEWTIARDAWRYLMGDPPGLSNSEVERQILLRREGLRADPRPRAPQTRIVPISTADLTSMDRLSLGLPPRIPAPIPSDVYPNLAHVPEMYPEGPNVIRVGGLEIYDPHTPINLAGARAVPQYDPDPGVSGGGVVKTPDGDLYYAKRSQALQMGAPVHPYGSPEAARHEMWGLNMMRAAGAPAVPAGYAVDVDRHGNPRVRLVSRMVPHVETLGEWHGNPEPSGLGRVAAASNWIGDRDYYHRGPNTLVYKPSGEALRVDAGWVEPLYPRQPLDPTAQGLHAYYPRVLSPAEAFAATQGVVDVPDSTVRDLVGAHGVPRDYADTLLRRQDEVRALRSKWWGAPVAVPLTLASVLAMASRPAEAAIEHGIDKTSGAVSDFTHIPRDLVDAGVAAGLTYAGGLPGAGFMATGAFGPELTLRILEATGAAPPMPREPTIVDPPNWLVRLGREQGLLPQVPGARPVSPGVRTVPLGVPPSTETLDERLLRWLRPPGQWLRERLDDYDRA